MIVEKGAVKRLPEVIARYNATKVFVLADENTYKAAGEKVCNILEESKMTYSTFVFKGESPEPDEFAVGSCMMHYDTSCNIIVGTAPSMDGYASGTSSMAMDGLKVSLNTTWATVFKITKDIRDKDVLSRLVWDLGVIDELIF